ncbi:hypothetical protein [Aurantiacibacter marinus]|uniref:Lipoprotein n=2 Tax=Aurantiacibacter marinus TaxID=874156 RepID=A0A0H0XL69_9SPHN|nr:hypothetical protein [Aurantiacibacter marinus]KLI63308.1 hypothetical protein AAV99_11645 [Aurantiacibacter marinus]
MMRRNSCLLALALLAGCGAAESENYEAQSEISLEDVGASEAALPEGFTLPSGTQVAQNTRVSTANGDGWVIYLDSASSPESLEEHFAAQAEAAGFVISVEMNQSGSKQLRGARADGMKFDFAALPHDGGSSRASLAIGRDRQD